MPGPCLQLARLRLTASAGGVRCAALGPTGWCEVAIAAAPEVVAADGRVVTLEPAEAGGGGDELRIAWAGPDLRLERRIVAAEDGWLAIETTLLPRTRLALRSFTNRWTAAYAPDWCFLPSVGGSAPDAQYKAPLALLQGGPLALAIVPDLAILDRAVLERCTHLLGLDAPARSVASGFVPVRLAAHCVYQPDPGRAWQADAPVIDRVLVRLTADAAPGEAFRDAVRLHWRRFGRPAQRAAAAQQAATGPELAGLVGFAGWRAAVWAEISPREWLDVPLPGGGLGGAVATRRWGGGPSVYLGSWFNSMRTAVGMAAWARRTGRDDLLALAGRTRDLALAAPGRDGAFACIAVPGADGVRWGAGDGCGRSTADGYLGYDMAWTGYWLLRWRAEGLPGGDAVLPRARALGAFLARWQEADGMLPTVFGADARPDRERSRRIPAETGAVALFLLELATQDGDPAWRRAGLRALDFIAAAVAPERRWFDFETFWSCSPREAVRDAATAQWPANNLALIPTVHAFLQAWRLTGEPRLREIGRRLLDELLLYQQCWTNPLLEGLTCPEMLLGGFTTQNSDAEWSDARQSQAGLVLLDWWRETGEAELLERAVAALRAQFPVAPAENWAHDGYGGKAGTSSFHWGTGSGMAGIDLAWPLIGDLVVDLATSTAVGVDAIDVRSCTVADRRLELALAPHPARRGPIRLIGHRAAPGTWTVALDGAEVARVDASAIAAGVDIALPVALSTLS